MPDKDAIDQQEMADALGRLLSSETLKARPKEQQLLAFLANRSLQDSEPTEHEIAVGLFTVADPNNPGARIRAMVQNLRGTLANYYKHAADEAVTVSISRRKPSGGYRLSFERRLYTQTPAAPVRPTRIFVTYAMRDDIRIRDLYEYLSAKLRGELLLYGSSYLVRAEVKPGASLETLLSEAIENGDLILFFISKHFDHLKYPNENLSKALNLIVRGKARVVVVLIDNTIPVPLEFSDLAIVDLNSESAYDQLLGEIKGELQSPKRPIPEGTPVDTEQDFAISFDPSLSPEEIKAVLTALADYYRSCGGAGFELKLDLQEAQVMEPLRG